MTLKQAAIVGLLSLATASARANPFVTQFATAKALDGCKVEGPVMHTGRDVDAGLYLFRSAGALTMNRPPVRESVEVRRLDPAAAKVQREVDVGSDIRLDMYQWVITDEVCSPGYWSYRTYWKGESLPKDRKDLVSMREYAKRVNDDWIETDLQTDVFVKGCTRSDCPAAAKPSRKPKPPAGCAVAERVKVIAGQSVELSYRARGGDGELFSLRAAGGGVVVEGLEPGVGYLYKEGSRECVEVTVERPSTLADRKALAFKALRLEGLPTEHVTISLKVGDTYVLENHRSYMGGDYEVLRVNFGKKGMNLEALAPGDVALFARPDGSEERFLYFIEVK